MDIQTDSTRTCTLREEIERLGFIVSFSKGISMLPLIRTGRTYVSIIADDAPRVGDILHFEQERKGQTVNILHRLVEIRDDGTYLCRGDNNLHCEHVRRDQVVGRVEQIFWVQGAHLLMPRLLGAQRNTDGGYHISVTDPGYQRYVRIWTALWPVRRRYYWCRDKIGLRRRLARIPWLKRLYHRLRK